MSDDDNNYECHICAKGFSWDTYLWLTLGDFTTKNVKLWIRIYLTANRLSI